MELKFFSKRFIKKSDIVLLKKTRKRLVNNKIINHNGNFIEYIKNEKMIKVIPQDDEILELIEQYLVPALDDTWFDDEWRPKNYDFEKLPSKLKRYMYELDLPLFYRDFKLTMNFQSVEDYDDRLDRMIKVFPEYTDDDFEAYVIIGKPIPSTIGKKAYESARRAYRTVNALLKSNINIFEQFVTLTFAPAHNQDKHLELNRNRKAHEYDLEFEYVQYDDFAAVKKKYSQQIYELKRSLKADGIDFEYLTVWEIQKNGAYHFHMLTTRIPNREQYKVPDWLDYDHKKDIYNKGYGLKKWKYGKSDVQEITNHAQISTYVSKYILKSFYNVNEETYEYYKGQRKYFPSDGLIRPIQDYVDDDDIDKVLKELELDDLEPYVKDYTNPYNMGTITKKTYTKIKQKTSASLGSEYESGI